MAASAHELFHGRTEEHGVVGQGVSRGEISWLVVDAADEAAALTCVAAAVAASLGTAVLNSVSLAERIDATTWRYVARYEPYRMEDKENVAVPTNTISFDTTGGTQHITASKATTNKYPSTAPDTKQAIGYDGENVVGCDITVPAFVYTITKYIRNSSLSLTAIYATTGAVNSDSFLGQAAGQWLFLGASGQIRSNSDDLWEITYKFAFQPNQTGLTIGAVTGVAKAGWDYLWVLYGDDVDTASTPKRRIRVPVAVYCEQVYPRVAFAGLGL